VTTPPIFHTFPTLELWQSFSWLLPSQPVVHSLFGHVTSNNRTLCVVIPAAAVWGDSGRPHHRHLLELCPPRRIGHWVVVHGKRRDRHSSLPGESAAYGPRASCRRGCSGTLGAAASQKWDGSSSEAAASGSLESRWDDTVINIGVAVVAGLVHSLPHVGRGPWPV
jgi:hypothetical protein